MRYEALIIENAAGEGPGILHDILSNMNEERDVLQ